MDRKPKEALEPVTAIAAIVSIVANWKRFIRQIRDWTGGDNKLQSQKGGLTIMTDTIIKGVIAIIVFAAGYFGFDESLKTMLGTLLHLLVSFVVAVIAWWQGGHVVTYYRMKKAGLVDKFNSGKI